MLALLLPLLAQLLGPAITPPSRPLASAPSSATLSTPQVPASSSGVPQAPSGIVARAQGGVPVRIGELVTIRGIRSNQLVGQGLIVGLSGTGDTTNFTRQQISNLAAKLGLVVLPQDLAASNVAIVTITATLPPYPQDGMAIDCIISSYGDAKSLQGGLLLRAPLYGAADGPAIAVAQGPVILGGFSTGGQSASVQKNHTTSGVMISGALIEDAGAALAQMRPITEGSSIHLDLRRDEFQVASQIGKAIDAAFPSSATPLNSRTIRVRLPQGCTEESGKFPEFLANLLDITVVPFARARVVLNEKNATVIVAGKPTLGPCLVARGNLTISVAESPTVSQPNALSQGGQTTTVPRTELKVTEESRPITQIPGATTLTELTEALGLLGATPRELVSILAQIHSAGALYAEVEVY
ncbi:MAG: flagellar basal body P-ring protein FlgI [Planctomycetes bacterium]|nr:flagellar basal body P-ring protein FlgI [Planctomycetota bacterium]